jgi:hypothetical protein
MQVIELLQIQPVEHWVLEPHGFGFRALDAALLPIKIKQAERGNFRRADFSARPIQRSFGRSIHEKGLLAKSCKSLKQRPRTINFSCLVVMVNRHADLFTPTDISI